ncbi:MAG: hypothetical protein FJX80_02745 [Bacteroidetes bacterium]|nr:hypothetical protein [Bacteroidota bacterium]
MQFTFVFSSKEAHSLCYSLHFAPCPIWYEGNKEVVNLHPKNPTCQEGDVKKLLEVAGITKSPEKVVIVVHPEGHGTNADLQMLLNDLHVLNIKHNVINI